MIGIGVTLLGAIIGGVTAARRKGNRKDIAQYTVVYALIFTLVYFVGSILYLRAVV
jgi:hypothetical protein